MKNIIKNAIILTLITLVAGTALAFVYSITKEPIAEADAKATAEAYKMVFSSADAFEEIGFSEAAAASDSTIHAVSKAVSGSDTLGYVMTVSSKGYGGDIKLAIGIDKQGNITGISILDASNETPGLGAKVTEDEFTSQFKGLSSQNVESEVDAISGATYSTNGVKNAVNSALDYFGTNLQEGEAE